MSSAPPSPQPARPGGPGGPALAPGGQAGAPPADGPGVVRVANLTKQFGAYAAVDDLSFVMRPGRVTAFLGPNGAGKTTTLRMLLGLVQPTRGLATIGGQRYADLEDPLRTVGAALEATSFHPGRTGRDHLRVMAAAAGLPDHRVDEMLEMTGIANAANKRAGAYSLGMRQRLGLAAAMLGDPQVLMLDEPANGLDPDGIRWLRGFLRAFAAQGRTVIMSSHLLGEVEHTVDDVVIIARGRLAAAGGIDELRGTPEAFVKSSDDARLAGALERDGLVARPAEGGIRVESHELSRIGDIALEVQVAVHELRALTNNLEELYFQLTAGHPEPGQPVPGAPAQPAHSVPMSEVRPQ